MVDCKILLGLEIFREAKIRFIRKNWNLVDASCIKKNNINESSHFHNIIITYHYQKYSQNIAKYWFICIVYDFILYYLYSDSFQTSLYAKLLWFYAIYVL